jgi:hypothetical protein
LNARPIARVFDFDDTLASSRGFIRVLHCVGGQPANTKKWLGDMGLSGEPGPLGSIELSTEDYAHYAKLIQELLERDEIIVQKPEQKITRFPTDVVDYSGVSRLIDPRPIASTVNIAREAFSRGEILGIITGRSGLGWVYDVTRKKVEVDNRRDIASFMAKQGIALSLEDIHCVGDKPGGVPYNKAEAMRIGFVEKYDPDTIIFYDDDVRNLDAVGSVDRRIRCVDSRGMTEGEDSTQDILEKAKRRRRNISQWSRSLQKAGIY